MPNHIIIAVGGTGQMVLHYYTQLYLLGVINTPFQARIVDADEQYKSLSLLSTFLDEVLAGKDPTVSGIAAINYRQVKAANAATVGEAVTGLREVLPHHPATAFFDVTCLTKNTIQGLYARPALSTVIGAEYLELFQDGVPHDSHIVVVGSII